MLFQFSISLVHTDLDPVLYEPSSKHKARKLHAGIRIEDLRLGLLQLVVKRSNTKTAF